MAPLWNLSVLITRFVDDGFPGWVECEFADAQGRRHMLMDKVPIFTAEVLDQGSAYPQRGSARCEILSESTEPDGRELASITTGRPDAIESAEGLCEFIVLRSQLNRG